jgi:hypothetical protein
VYLPAPLLDGGPPPAAAGGLQDKPADAPGKWGEYAPPPTQGAGGDWEYVISPAAGDFATLARPAPEPTTAIALLTCLPILLRRRGGHGR